MSSNVPFLHWLRNLPSFTSATDCYDGAVDIERAKNWHAIERDKVTARKTRQFQMSLILKTPVRKAGEKKRKAREISQEAEGVVVKQTKRGSAGMKGLEKIVIDLTLDDADDDGQMLEVQTTDTAGSSIEQATKMRKIEKSAAANGGARRCVLRINKTCGTAKVVNVPGNMVEVV